MFYVLHLGLSYACNMKCKHCFVRKKEDRLKEEDYYRIIDAMCEKGLFVMYYTFGEPLCSSLFEKVSQYACKKNIVQVLMTNGSLLDERIISVLIRNRISKVCISLDHIDSNMHDINRDYKDAYVKAIDALHLLIKYNINAQISVTVNDTNVFCLNQIYELAKELNVNAVSFLRERNNKNVTIMQHEKAYFEFFRSKKYKYEKPNLLFHDYRLLPILKEMKEKNEISDLIYEKYYEMNCCHSCYTISVEPNGDVKRCNLNSRIIGNVLNKPIDIIVMEEMSNNECFDNCATVSK